MAALLDKPAPTGTEDTMTQSKPLIVPEKISINNDH
jgi:hypothetical protein